MVRSKKKLNKGRNSREGQYQGQYPHAPTIPGIRLGGETANCRGTHEEGRGRRQSCCWRCLCCLLSCVRRMKRAQEDKERGKQHKRRKDSFDRFLPQPAEASARTPSSVTSFSRSALLVCEQGSRSLERQTGENMTRKRERSQILAATGRDKRIEAFICHSFLQICGIAKRKSGRRCPSQPHTPSPQRTAKHKGKNSLKRVSCVKFSPQPAEASARTPSSDTSFSSPVSLRRKR